MTPSDPSPSYLRLTIAEPEPGGVGRLRIHLTGALDQWSYDRCVATVTRELAARPRLLHLHLDCTGLTDVDSSGLSALLMIHRHANAARVRLHLDRRTPRLDRLMDTTGTLEHLTSTLPIPADATQGRTSGQAVAYGRTDGPHAQEST